MPAPSTPSINKPNWATDDVEDPVTHLQNVQEPPDTKILSGMNRLEFMPRQWINWLFRSTGLWITYLQDFTDYLSSALATEVTNRTNADALLAPKASPALSGNPTAPTQSAGNNSTRIATTAYADTAAAAVGGTWAAWVPTVTITGGSVVSLGTNSSFRYVTIGKTVLLSIYIEDLAFTGSGALNLVEITLPSGVVMAVTPSIAGAARIFSGASEELGIYYNETAVTGSLRVIRPAAAAFDNHASITFSAALQKA